MNNPDLLRRNQAESPEDYLWRLGSLKESNVVDLTWRDIMLLMRRELPGLPYAQTRDESTWRKRYNAMRNNLKNQEDEEDIENVNDANNDDIDVAENTGDTDGDEFIQNRKALIKIRDHRFAINRCLRNASRVEDLLEQMKDAIQNYEPHEVPTRSVVDVDEKSRAIYAMLSDIHYGMEFHNAIGEFSPEIARRRVMHYADEICQIADELHIDTCYVSLMGDMISGNIHTMIRVENRENVVQQVVGVSELVSDFLYKLSLTFSNVIVNSVAGNHSRVSLHDEDVSRAEKLDALVPWYCAAKLSSVHNVNFIENDTDDSIASYEIFGKQYFAVHGDYEKNMSDTVQRLTALRGGKVDYLLAGHMHVAESRIEESGMIRNGSVCGSGDEYTVKKRLFAPPCQVCMVVNDSGVESIHPVLL